MDVCFRCVHPDRGRSPDDGGGLPGMLRGDPGVPLYAGTGSYPVCVNPHVDPSFQFETLFDFSPVFFFSIV